MGRLVKVRDVEGPKFFSTSPIEEEENHGGEASAGTGAGRRVTAGLTLPTAQESLGTRLQNNLLQAAAGNHNTISRAAELAQVAEQNTNPLTTPAESGFFEGVSILPSSPNGFVRDVGYGTERIGAGLLGGLEGVSDFLGAGFGKAVQGITSLGGLAPNPVSEWGGRVADYYLDTSPTQDYEESIRARYNPTRGMENVTGVEQTIAQMLPGIGVSWAVSAAGNALNAAQAASRGANAGRALFGLQAAGQSAQQARQEGADTDQALAYGLASGLLESSIESVAGGIPGLGDGQIGGLVRSPALRTAADIAGEGAEEAASTVITPYLQRAMYNPDAPNATPEEIAQSALIGSLAAGVLQGGLELPAYLGERADTRNRVTQAAEANLNNPEFVRQGEEQVIRDVNSRINDRTVAPRRDLLRENPLETMLPTWEEVQRRQAGSPVQDNRLVLPGIDRQTSAGYDGDTPINQTGGVNNGRGEPAASELHGVYAADVRNGAPGTYTRGEGTSSQINGGENQGTAEWAVGHLIETPTPAAGRALYSARQYAPDVFVVDNNAIKSRSPSAWALTSDGKIYISDAVPENLADVVGYHESVHALKQRGSQQYEDFVSQIGERLNYGEYADRVLGIILQSRLKGKSILDLTVDELDTAYDELNAVVWGYHKADPENARAQFSGVFRDYDAYIRELDGIMEGAASSQEEISGAIPLVLPGGEQQTGGQDAALYAELPTASTYNTEDIYDIYGSGSENLPETAVGANKASPWDLFVSSSTEFFPEGANAARDVDVPTTDPQGRRIRKTAATAMGARAIPDEAIADIQNMVLRGELSYNRVSDKASIDRAVKTIQDKGYQGALEEFRSAVSKGVVSKDIATLGQQLLVNAANAGDGRVTADLLTLYAQMETTAGQAVQAASILRKLAPSDQLYAAQRTVSELEKTIRKSYKDIEITIDQSLIEEFNNQTTQEGRDQVLDKIYQNVADQIPSKWKDKWNAWRYLAMLANPRTHVRNFAGNVFFQPLRITKDRVAAAIEAGVSLASGGRLERSKVFLTSPDLYRAAWADWMNVREALSGNKYNDIRSDINSRRTIFRTKPLEVVRKGNSWLLEFEDSIFKRFTYTDALAGYLQAHGVTAEQVQNNVVDANLMARARDYAGQEALRATYQDRNAVSDKVVQVANVLGPAGEAILPFKRTPANILVRGLEYSPVGLAKALTYDLVQVKRGNMTGAQAIDHIAAGLTSSGLFALGAYLFSQGIVTSGGGDDENQDALNELTGSQNYALNLPGGGSVTLDWLAPEALPFFMGVELMDSMGQSGNTTDSIMNALKSVTDPMLELSMLQSLNDVIDSVSFSENKLGALASSAVISYFTQPIPTLWGQFERTGEENRMSTYTDKNLMLPTDVQYAIGRASARIPGWDYQQIPYIDAWGREESNGPLVLRAANNFLNPAYTSSLNVTPVDEEIQRLYDQTGDGAVVPERPNRYITVNGERIDLSADQYVQYATERGQTQFSILEDLVGRRQYQSMDDADKAFVVDSVYEYSDAVSKANISEYAPDGWVAKLVDSGLDPADYILFRAAISDISGDGKKQEIMDVIDSMDISRSDKDRYYYAAGYSESTIDDAPWH